MIFTGRVFWHVLNGKAWSSLDTLSTASMKALGPSTGCVGTLQHCFSQGSRHPSVSRAVHCIARFAFRFDL